MTRFWWRLKNRPGSSGTSSGIYRPGSPAGNFLKAMKTNRKEGETDIRLDHRLICARITPGADVLDLGCGDGTLMSLLVREKQARVQGIELDGEAVQRCVAQGLMVFQGDIEGGLKDFPDRSFDDVILNQSMQEVR
ncbi:MAG TPA: hypothetical protein DCS11_09590, partial [Syntrophus sp. (in: bacteria)]|nr:hypothetical protein [Syntrophus sp. (in: bacteria)]